MTQNLLKALNIPQLRSKIIFTVVILALYRFLAHIPVPNVDVNVLREFFASSSFLNFFNVFSGGGLGNFSIIALGLGPYITASIIMQMMTIVVPKLEELSKEGAFGRQKINQYTQALTLPLSLIQAFAIYKLFSSQTLNGVQVLGSLAPFELLVVILSMTAGSFLLIWLGEQITSFGVGNGISVLIFAGILSGIPTGLGGFLTVFDASQIITIIVFAVVSLLVIASVVYINEAYRKIEVQYSSRVKGNKSVGGGSSFIPIKINQAGVIPIIFAVSLVLLPSALGGYLQQTANPAMANIGTWLSVNFVPSSPVYNIFYFLLVFGFTYFYTSITFNPEKIASDIRDRGGFIPGVRPGKATEEFLGYVIHRLTLTGGIFLGVIAVMPSVVQGFTGIAALAIGGTGLLIVVSVILQTVKQVESQVITREYETLGR